MEKLCELRYRYFETEYGEGCIVDRCVPLDGVFLYEVSAAYARQIPSTYYYVLGGNVADARRRFLFIYSWMDVRTVRLIPPGAEAESVLTNPLKMPMR